MQAIEDIPMTVTSILRQRGLNRVLVYTSERPAMVAGVPGEVRVACFEAFFNGGHMRQPADGIMDVTHAHLEELRTAFATRIAEVASSRQGPGAARSSR